MSSAFLKKLNFKVAFDCKTPKVTCAQPSAPPSTRVSISDKYCSIFRNR